MRATDPADIERQITSSRGWEMVPTFQRPRCKWCGSSDIKTTRSIADQGDGSTLRYAKCRGCDKNMKYILE